MHVFRTAAPLLGMTALLVNASCSMLLGASPRRSTASQPQSAPSGASVVFPETHFDIRRAYSSANASGKDQLYLTVTAYGARNGEVSLRLAGHGKEQTVRLSRDFCLGVGGNEYLSASPCSFVVEDLVPGAFEIQALLGGKVAATRTIHLKEVFSLEWGRDKGGIDHAQARRGKKVLILDPDKHGEKLALEPRGKATYFHTMSALEARADFAIVWLKGENVVALTPAQTPVSPFAKPSLRNGGPLKKVVPFVARDLPKLEAGMRAVVLMNLPHASGGKKTAIARFRVTEDAVQRTAKDDYGTLIAEPSAPDATDVKAAMAAPWRTSSAWPHLLDEEAMVCAAQSSEEARSKMASYVYFIGANEGSAAVSAAREHEANTRAVSSAERRDLQSQAAASREFAGSAKKEIEQLEKQLRELGKSYPPGCFR